MPHEVIMLALGMVQDTGLIVAWHRSSGDTVKADDVLFEVETDKSTVEVPAGADGVVTQIRHAAGTEVPVGDVIALIGDSAEEALTQAERAPPGPGERSARRRPRRGRRSHHARPRHGAGQRRDHRLAQGTGRCGVGGGRTF